jgi:hypothetical protein
MMSVPVVTRAQWGAAFTIPGGRFVAPSARRWFVVHWPGSAVSGDERAVVRSIERSHRQGQGWAAAPGYNYLVGRSGTIYDGCGRDVRGIHSPPRNTDGFGVCVMIAVGEQPPQAALNATRALYNWLNQVCGRTLGMSWHGQHHPTQCAGPALNSWVQRGMPAATAPAPAPPGQPTGMAETPTSSVAQVNLVWNTVTGPASQFTVQVQRGNTGTANVRTFTVPVPSAARTTFTVSDLAPRELHRWRVSRGSWSAWRQFRTP